MEVEDTLKVLKFVSGVFNNMKFQTKNITRIGIRFVFLRDEKSFKDANDQVLNLFSSKFYKIQSMKNISRESVTDSVLVYRYTKPITGKSDKYDARIAIGALQRSDFAQVFVNTSFVQYTNPIHIDYDYSIKTYPFNLLSLDKLISDVKDEIFPFVADIYEQLRQ